MDTFFNNVSNIRNAGASFTVELTANDVAAKYTDEIKQICMNNLGAVCHIVESRKIDSMISRFTQLPYEDHIKIWDNFQSPSFEIQKQTWGIKRTEFCYAGDWIVDFFMETGDMSLCLSGGHLIQNLYDNLDEPIHFAAIGRNCPWAHCCSPYVTLTSGAIPSLKTPTYTDMRNRICADGTEWLGPKVKAFFSSQCWESNQEYSEDKKAYIDALMAVEYDNQENHYSKQEISGILGNQLTKKGIRSVSIYGTEKMGNWLADLLKDTSICVKFMVVNDYVDNNKPAIKTKAKRFVKYYIKHVIRHDGKPVLLNQYDRWPKTDMIIVSLYPQFVKIAKSICSKAKGPVISLTELID